MPRVKRSSIENLRQRVSLLEVVAPYTQMKRAGAQYRGLSPFNPEKTPSFYVHPEKNVFMDYSSGNAGDLFRFVQLKENLEFGEAIELLAERFSVPLEYEDDGQPRERLSLRKELLGIHEAATDYYHRCFQAEHADSTAMREYWTGKRRFPLKLADEFQIGFAPSNGGKLLDVLHKKGFSGEAIAQCGLFYVNDHDTAARAARPRFRGRLMIPIRDVQGRVIAFTARQTDLTPQDDPSREAKYINSPETPLFKKSDVLFGLERARQHVGDGQSLILVEGQLDCLRCVEKGILNAVAPQGTAITEHQLALLRRYTSRAEVLLDGDSAGQKAALRMLPLALKAGLDVRFLRLPAGSDPDELLAEGGAEALEALRAESLSWIDFATGVLVPPTVEPGSPEERRGLDEIFGTIAQSESEVIREQALAGLAIRLSRVDRLALHRDFERFISGQARPAAPEPSDSLPRLSSEALTTAESQLLLIALHSESLARSIANAVDHQWVNDKTPEGALFRKLLIEFQNDAWSGLDDFIELLESDEERNYLYALLNRDVSLKEPEQQVLEPVGALYRRHLAQLQKELDLKLMNTPPENAEAIRGLHRQRIELRKLLRQPPVVRF
ncbi:DNA primase [Ruficoccus amylovorans]|uniref:DNA primase n=1 Tax=Ruficoccus amylovorans TaxID=1804625 RepID=A0A842HC04_9BACT|nr:DNA primase [Ruficoccus amylovorans]MBC2593094.1 DNA primase [Ruficoccus amylovorans]